MSRFKDYYSDGEVKDIMERFIERFPTMFTEFNADNIAFITTKKKRSTKAIRLVPIVYPMEAFIQKPYIVEVYEERWRKLTPKQRNLAVFHIMCAIPDGGLDDGSKQYGKKVRPEISMYMREFAASGGVPNWMENPAAVDPMERTEKEVQAALPVVEVKPEKEGEGTKAPVKPKVVAAVGPKPKKAALAAAAAAK